MTLRTALLWLLPLVLAVAAAQWFYRNFERVSEAVEVGYRGEARRNPWLAAQRFFAAFGAPARTLERLDALPPQDAVLIVPTPRWELGAAQARRLRAWVEGGGHLVVVPTAAFGRERPDALLDPLGVRVRAIEKPDSDGLVDVAWPGINDFFAVTLDPRVRLDFVGAAHAVLLDLRDADGAYLLRLRLGRGWLTVLVDAAFMRNARIGRDDNAVFLWHVAQPDAPRPVWWVLDDRMPPLPLWLAQHAWTALVSAAVLIVLGLWAALPRFGPVVPAPVPARRRLLDHVRASGRFLWRHGHVEHLLRAVRHALFRTLERRHPAWSALPSTELYRRLAALARMPEEEVQRALLYTHAGSEHEFTQVIRSLERLRKAL